MGLADQEGISPISGKGLTLAASGNTVYAGKREGELFLSLDDGDTWTDVTENLAFPFGYFKEIRFAGSTAYVSTDMGVMHSRDGETWEVGTDVDGNRDFTYPERFGEVIASTASQTDFLPRVVLNYRLSDNTIFRAGYYSTASRPQISNITRAGSVTNLDLQTNYGPTGNQPRLTVRQGNPDLKPAYTHNFDASWERYSDDVGVIKASLFYKTIDNALSSTFDRGDISIIPETVSLPDTPDYNNLPDNLFVEVTQPVNGNSSQEIWGGEVSIERQLSALPSVLSGLGVYANYTYSDSRRDIEQFATGGVDVFLREDVPFAGAPKHSGTFGLTYSNYGIDGSLIYTVQSRRFSGVGVNGFDIYDESIDTLDLRIDYKTDLIGTNSQIYFIGRDLLTGEDDTYLQRSIGGENGVPRYITSGSYFGGRSFALGLSVSF